MIFRISGRMKRKRRPLPSLKATPRLIEPKFTDSELFELQPRPSYCVFGASITAFFRPALSQEEKENNRLRVPSLCDIPPHRINSIACAARKREKQSSIRDFFTPRRSSRRTKSELAKEKESQVVQAVRSGSEDGLAVSSNETIPQT